MMTAVRDEFLSEEDLDLRNLTDEELVAYWNQWLEQAQATNAADEHTYSHGVFACGDGLGSAASKQIGALWPAVRIGSSSMPSGKGASLSPAL